VVTASAHRKIGPSHERHVVLPAPTESADNGFVIEGELTAERLGAIVDPAQLLMLAWRLEPQGRWPERAAALDRLADVLAGGGVAPAAPGRNWDLELAAERAIDVGRKRDLDGAEALVARVLRDADPAHGTAIARALLARGQALAWLGTDEAVRESRRAFTEAADRFAALGRDDWRGSALLRCGYSAYYQFGDFVGAEALIAQALEAYPPDSDRRFGALGSYADVLVDLGEFDRAEAALLEALALAERNPLPARMGELTWGLARVAAGRGDARATERLLREAERGSAGDDWFDTHIGLSYVLEAAELLDRVGLAELARVELERARERARERAGAESEEVMQTSAVMCARSGDPWRALEQLQELARLDWVEKRTIWRHTLMTAWATFRAGRGDAGTLAARALEQAAACGTVRVATAGEPDIVLALAPLAQTAGSAIARELLLDGRTVIVRLFGTPGVVRRDGSSIPLPSGRPGELVRMLAVEEHGLPSRRCWRRSFPRPPRQAAATVCARSSPGCGRPPASSSSATARTFDWCPRGSIYVSSTAPASGSGAPAARGRRSSPTARSRCTRGRCCRAIRMPPGLRRPVTGPSIATSSCSTSSPPMRRRVAPIRKRSPLWRRRSFTTPQTRADAPRWSSIMSR
jgi:tetratricopeptide (TPR) repeat protein